MRRRAQNDSGFEDESERASWSSLSSYRGSTRGHPSNKYAIVFLFECRGSARSARRMTHLFACLAAVNCFGPSDLQSVQRKGNTSPTRNLFNPQVAFVDRALRGFGLV